MFLHKNHPEMIHKNQKEIILFFTLPYFSLTCVQKKTQKETFFK